MYVNVESIEIYASIVQHARMYVLSAYVCMQVKGLTGTPNTPFPLVGKFCDL